MVERVGGGQPPSFPPGGSGETPAQQAAQQIYEDLHKFPPDWKDIKKLLNELASGQLGKLTPDQKNLVNALKAGMAIIDSTKGDYALQQEVLDQMQKNCLNLINSF